MTSLITAIAITVLAASSLLDGEITLVSDNNSFSEGPVWIPGEGLVHSDVPTSTLYRADHSIFRKPSNGANGLVLDTQGRLLACESRFGRITRTEADGTITVLAAEYEGNRFNSTNDITVRADGLVYFTDPGARKSKPEGRTNINGVYRLDPESGEVTLLTDTLRYPNGIGFSPDGNTLYVADYMNVRILAYDVAQDGSCSNERTFCEVPNPDGFAVDSQGNIWTSQRKGISVISPEGKLLETFEVPSAPTNCTFGGEDGKTLYITARKNVFKVRTKVKGQGKF